MARTRKTTVSGKTIADKILKYGWPHVSGKMWAILGYLLDQPLTRPRLTEMVITSDGFVLGQVEGDVGLNKILGDDDDLTRNVRGMLGCVDEITAAERRWVVRKLATIRVA